MWDVTGHRRLISNPQAPDTTEFVWSPDGVHFITATTTPRLRIGNGYRHSTVVSYHTIVVKVHMLSLIHSKIDFRE